MSPEIFQFFSTYPEENVIIHCTNPSNSSFFVAKPEGEFELGKSLLYYANKIEDIYEQIGWYSESAPPFISVNHMNFSRFVESYPEAKMLKDKKVKVSYQIIPPFFSKISIGLEYYLNFSKKDLKIGRSVTFIGDVDGTIEVQ